MSLVVFSVPPELQDVELDFIINIEHLYLQLKTDATPMDSLEHWRKKKSLLTDFTLQENLTRKSQGPSKNLDFGLSEGGI